MTRIPTTGAEVVLAELDASRRARYEALSAAKSREVGLDRANGTGPSAAAKRARRRVIRSGGTVTLPAAEARQ